MMRIGQYIHVAVWAKRHLCGQIRPPELEVVRPFLSPSSICFDIGAHAGSWARGLAKFVEQGFVYAFEALPYYADILSTTMKLLGCTNVSVINAAVTENDCSVPMIWKDTSGRRLTGMTHIAASSHELGEKIYVRGIALDSFWESLDEKKIDFVKCDVEGAELFVLKGAQHLIDRCRPVFFNEIDEEWCRRYNYLPKDIFCLFEEFDYTPYKVGPDHGLLPVDASTPYKHGDVLFVPNERPLPKPGRANCH